ncbi:hypothetical protein E5083_18810 [Streptomyces bauhiniae]|uniref:Uncharacterized protein n=1 Tax=Streptomyces bauhiniae TaxID=2340725 RepID=A0A4Z1D2Z9_9ACTN|nr:hypothetical protein [Streptomyces bauhiniae]TGN75701.1 hypothetical protein E5083_18810 [Streptomyces bauhiniae]
MAIVAILLLPVVTMLLYGMDRTEDWLARGPKPPRHARARHLRLIHGGRRQTAAAVDQGETEAA